MKRFLVVAGILGAGGLLYYYLRPTPPDTIVLTGIVTTDHILVAPQVGGRIEQLLVREGDTVQAGQLIAVLAPDELAAERSYYASGVESAASQVGETEAELRFQIDQTSNQILEAEANLAVALAQRDEAVARRDDAQINLDRTQKLVDSDVAAQETLDQARTGYDAAVAQLDAAEMKIDAQEAALSQARANATQVEARRMQAETARQQRNAAAAQQRLADVRLAYAEVRSPTPGVVDVRAAHQGEVVTAGETIVALIDPDDLWVRTDVEETYIDRIRIGDQLTVRLPSGSELAGTVFYRSADAGFATQRDVSRTKRDIRTFEIRLRVDNADRRLATGMTIYVELPIGE